MTDKEKAEEYVSPKVWGDTYFINCCGDWSNKEMEKAYLDGLAEGRKENDQLKAQIEKMKCCGNCKYIEFRYFTESMKAKNMINYCSDCIRFIKKNKKDKWELAE